MVPHFPISSRVITRITVMRRCNLPDGASPFEILEAIENIEIGSENAVTELEIRMPAGRPRRRTADRPRRRTGRKDDKRRDDRAEKTAQPAPPQRAYNAYGSTPITIKLTLIDVRIIGS